MTTEIDHLLLTMVDKELAEAFLNARQTYYEAQTCSKSLWNGIRMEKFKKELTERGLPIPTGEGVFNGPGSY
jgi:hypothetical protein